ncbi:phosphomannomutase [Rhizobiales bacterium RZME27]|jgi:phosphomannomutase|uniref:Phosphomannomutase n=1 Tax=Endobacterium cereale TaxID=2663029 RepID=A0A6A8AHJ9_9HYPH|nr:phosphomannomutase [Endobacterium cereale]MEB2847469.1 phosphomannomutase [Endobacterium cereale]MQY49318.1 phosphomannomutase [Endobacterium cereale]
MKFGTSGLRGLVTDLQGRSSALYATAFAKHLLEKGFSKPGDRIFVGGDYRPSSPDIAATCIGALARAGLRPVDCGAIPTPALAFYAMMKGAGSLMVTGSHIPADRNGIKFYRPDGEIDKTDEQEISRIAAEIGDTAIDASPAVAENEGKEAIALFLARNSVVLPGLSLSGMRIGVYQHSTVARDYLVEVIAGYGAEVVTLGRSDLFIPVDTEAVSPQTIESLRLWANEYQLDGIVSADGDGDRPLMADETGAPLRGDLLGMIVARFLEAEIVVTPVTSNSGIDAAGVYDVLRTRVGSPYVIEGMNSASAGGGKAIMGFEANGGVLTHSDFGVAGGQLKALPTRDSFLPILATLFLAKQQNTRLSALASAYRLPFATAGRLENFPIEDSAALMVHLRASAENLDAFFAPVGNVEAVSDIDGLRVTLDNRSIIHLRPSGNAPEMRCYVEAINEMDANSLLDHGLSLVRNWAKNR